MKIFAANTGLTRLGNYGELGIPHVYEYNSGTYECSYVLPIAFHFEHQILLPVTMMQSPLQLAELQKVIELHLT